MHKRKLIFAFVLCVSVLGIAGCRHEVVRSAPPPPPPPTTVEPMPQPVPAPPPPETTKVEPAPEPVPEPVPAVAAPAPAPPRRPAPVEPPKAKVEAEPPQISPALSPKDQADAMRSTTADIGVAEKNLQLAEGKKLNASQADLVEKVKGFLSQSHEAIRANDWVRARNLALKAQILSTELIKSL